MKAPALMSGRKLKVMNHTCDFHFRQRLSSIEARHQTRLEIRLHPHVA
ncbi:hypothetical protein B0G74_8785 [Paraburkholderia sp. BL9I2N2]|nr:hypothetical protein B0G74_8785 [Paraburkholderia sp. BL9I2N2]